MNRTKKTILILSAFLLMAFTAAQADVIVPQTTPIGSNTVDWSSIGLPVGTQLHAFVGFSADGDTATVSVANPISNKGEIIQQGTNWNGNFMPGEYGIWTRNNGPLTVSFGNSYNFIGAFFKQNVFGPFTASLSVYTGSTLLGTVTLAGNSQPSPGTAIFIGALDKTGPNITKVIFSETAGASQKDFAIATMYLGVPEPGTMVLLGSWAWLVSLAAARTGNRIIHFASSYKGRHERRPLCGIFRSARAEIPRDSQAATPSSS